jgi:hypothetical protein
MDVRIFDGDSHDCSVLSTIEPRNLPDGTGTFSGGTTQSDISGQCDRADLARNIAGFIVDKSVTGPLNAAMDAIDIQFEAIGFSTIVETTANPNLATALSLLASGAAHLSANGLSMNLGYKFNTGAGLQPLGPKFADAINGALTPKLEAFVNKLPTGREIFSPLGMERAAPVTAKSSRVRGNTRSSGVR